ncbi:MAG: adenylate/guanylate cyclase domain-containing protein [Chloroflexota bacterium]
MQKNKITLLELLANLGSHPEDSEEIKLQKAILTIISFLIATAGMFWGGLYFYYGVPLSGIVPMSYAIISYLSLLIFFRTKSYKFFRFSQLLLMLFLPFILQWSLGGIALGSMVMIWAFLNPLGALMFEGPKKATPWFAAYVALNIFSGWLDPRLPIPANRVPENGVILLYVMNITVMAFITFGVLRYFVLQRDAARQRSEELLDNMLPKQIADELRVEKKTTAKQYKEASILFADLVGFTSMSEEMTPTEMIALLNEIYSKFDQFVENFGVEKIRTIGDNYMVASGVPESRDDHAQAIANLALAMQSYAHQLRLDNGHKIEFRIGINSGPLIAGVVGQKKFQYDIWGDAVNIASRMESHGIPGKIQVAESTFQLLKEDYAFEPRGLLSIKGKGELKTWFLTSNNGQV